MRGSAMLATALLLAPAAGRDVGGEYDSPIGRVRVAGDGVTFSGVIVEPAESCPFRAGDEVLRATLLDDSLAGQVRVCLRGDSCGASEQWASAVLLVQGSRLSGAVHVAGKGCSGPVGKKGGIVFARTGGEPGPAAAAPPAATAAATRKAKKTPGSSRERARAIMRDGAAYLHEGKFEAARARFLDAIDVDARIPEAYNGVGVTFRMRNDLAGALAWYKKALAVDPDFGDAYYNMACVYALRGEKEMALRYLQIAALNGYATAEGIGEDPDLELLRSEPGYRALVQAKM